MLANNTDERLHYRFPAFDDETGVKIQNPNRRVLFQDDDFYNESYTNTTDYYENDVPINQFDSNYSNDYTVQSSKDSQFYDSLDSVHFNQPEPKKTRVQKHINKLKRRPAAAIPKKDYTSAYSKSHQTNTSSYLNNSGAMPKKDYGNVIPKQSYFVPKHIPPSAHVKENQTTQEASKYETNSEELLQAMKEEKKDYLLFDFTEQTNFPNKKSEDDPTIHNFKRQPEEVTEVEAQAEKRQQLNRAKRNYLDSDQVDEVLSRARQQIRTGKKQAQIATPYEQKQEKLKRKNSRLEKSLSGIMQDQSPELEKSRYFDV